MLKYLILFFASMASAQPVFDAAAVEAFRAKLNSEFGSAGSGPLTDEDLKNFDGLDFFPIDSSFFVQAKFVRTPHEKPFRMKTTTSRLPEYIKYGELHFSLGGRNLALNVYQSPELAKRPGFEDYLFLPFSDLTNGNETYIGGRYIDFRIPGGDTASIDFNMAYNPYCAYNYKYSCPVVPLENDLPVEIRAGVKKFHD